MNKIIISTLLSATCIFSVTSGVHADEGLNASDPLPPEFGCPDNIYDGDYTGSAAGLEGFTRVTGNVLIQGSAPTLAGMECLEVVDGNLSLGTRWITSFDGIERLSYVGGELYAYKANKLTDISALASLEYAGGLRLSYVRALTSLNGLESLVEIGDGRLMIANSSITDLHGLDNLETVGGHIRMIRNPYLSTLDGLDALTVVGGTLHIDDNDALTSLDPFDSMQYSGALIIERNDALVDASVLSGLTLGGEGLLWFRQNSQLPQCDAKAIVGAITGGTHDGHVSVSNNLGGCECTISCAPSMSEGCFNYYADKCY